LAIRTDAYLCPFVNNYFRFWLFAFHGRSLIFSLILQWGHLGRLLTISTCRISGNGQGSGESQMAFWQFGQTAAFNPLPTIIFAVVMFFGKSEGRHAF
jgi:hypothetical protein